MAGVIKKQIGVTPKLIEGAGGVFNVVVDGRKIWSKHDTGRFPEADEILSQLTPVR